MAKTTSDSTETVIPAGAELVTVSHPDGRTDEVPLDAALALEAQKTGWVRDDKAKIAALQAQVDALQAQLDEATAAAKADEAENKRGRKPAAAKADEADDTKSEED